MCGLNLFYEPGKLFCKLFIPLLLILFGNQTLLAQRYHFSHYDIEDGLIQSQVRAFTQSPSRHLWIATQGGASRFDGSQFTSFTRNENGLAGMSVMTLLADTSGKIYLGTENGLSVYQGKNILNYRLPGAGADPSWVHALVQDKNGRIYGLIKEKLFTFSENKIRLVNSPGISDEYVTALATAPNGNIYAAVHGKGIYELKNNIWVLKIVLPKMPKPLSIMRLFFDRNKKDKLWVLTPGQIFILENQQLTPFRNKALDSANRRFFSIEQDAKSNLWIGASMGVYCIGPEETIFFNSANGFTDNSVNQIFRDAENNMWFATEGAGVYKYDGDKTMFLDKNQGLSNEVVMGFVREKNGTLWVQSFGNSIVKMQSGKMISVKLPVPDSVNYNISQLFNDREGNIWIGTAGAGLWKYDGVSFKNFPFREGKVPKVIRHIMQDKKGTIWLATPTGCYTLSNGEFSHLKDFEFPVSALLESGTDSVLVNSAKGLYSVTGKDRRAALISLPEIQKKDIYTMMKYKGRVFFGTGEDGILVWDFKKKAVEKLTVKNGLYSNTIYSLIADKQGNVWAGTGRGINKILINPRTAGFTVSGAEKSKRLIVECNQNAVFLDHDKLWVGTTKGALVFDLKPDTVKKDKPHIILQTVRLFSSIIKSKTDYFSSADGYSLPQNLQLAYRDNQISLNFKGIYLTNPSDVLYQYRLLGLNDVFSNPTPNSSVNYQGLPPGDYIFEARALSKSGITSGNILRFPFAVQPAFYQTLAFRLAVIFLFILSGIGLQAYLHRRKTHRLQLIENMKQEERLKTRRQTAEDFHDDLGNKLTRISILTDILNTKLNGSHQEERHLISQIKENASSLYRGTKDILWALDPKSDNLFEILCHISEFGMELFQDTAIDFNYQGIDEPLSQIKFPMEYSRNISMIFKESLNNILRHAEATHVSLRVVTLERSVEVCLKDDGKGFNPRQVQKHSGLNNISVRAKRIGADLNIDSLEGNGTIISLSILKDLKPAT